MNKIQVLLILLTIQVVFTNSQRIPIKAAALPLVKAASLLPEKQEQNNNKVILASGLINWDYLKLEEQYNAYRSYKRLGLITGSSINVYSIDKDGGIGLHAPSYQNITAEEYQYRIKQNLKLGAYPCFYCDATL